MGKREKRRKAKDEETAKTDSIVVEDANSPRTKPIKRKVTDETGLKKHSKKKKSSNHDGVSEPKSKSTSNEVQLGSLQSIFSTKAEADNTFTLFGGEPPSERSPESLRPSTVQTTITTIPEQSQKKILYFFPHYDHPEKNALSLFPVSDEPFFHDRTDEEKRRIWEETKYELTQDWKKKKKTAMKLKRRREIRRKI